MAEDIKAVIAEIAVKLFGREHRDAAPEGGRHWCLSAKDRYKDEFSGPWFKYAEDTDWTCELCNTDRYLSEYGDRYLLGGAGMLHVITALQAAGHDLIMQTRFEGESGCWVHLGRLESPFSSFHVDGGMHRGDTFPEAVARAALIAVGP